MRPVTLMTNPHLLSLLLSLNKVLKSYLPMALGIFAHNNGQRCSSLWVNLPIVVGKLYSCTSSFIIIVIFLARTLLYIYSTFANGEVKISLHLPSIMQGINAEPLTLAPSYESIQSSIKTITCLHRRQP